LIKANVKVWEVGRRPRQIGVGRDESAPSHRRQEGCSSVWRIY